MSESKDLSLDTCMRIVKLVNEASGHIVNVMGEGGRILASSDPARIGTVHDGTKRIMAGDVHEIAIDQEMARTMQGVQPGYTGAVLAVWREAG